MSIETVETKEQFGPGDKGIQRKWMLELKLADKREANWRKTSKAIIEKYRGTNRKKNSFNILWSNTETLMPAVYNALPKPDVRRRFKDADPIGKAVSEVISRCLEFSIDIAQFDTAIKQGLLDMLLTGRGVSRVRYVPSFELVGSTDEESGETESVTDELMESEQSEELAWEQVVIEHVQWDDFRISAGKTWEEVCWIAFHHRMSREDLIEKFGKAGEIMKLDDTNDEDVNKEDDSTSEAFKTASVWEIWDKDEKQVIFVSQNAATPLKIVDDPLELSGFFPIARPIYAITDSSTMIPLALYSQYQEQADELDRISTRINKLLDALKVRGIYDSTMSEVSELLKGNDNDLIPAQNAAAWLERGGIEKAIWMMPIDKAAQVITILTQQREACKNVIYEINGLGDILRGASNASETLGAQQIKQQWGTMRISTLQRELQRYIRDTMRIMSELISEKFQLETLQKMTALPFPTEAQVQQQMTQYQQQAMMMQQQGQQPPPPPQPPPFTWESIQEVMRDDCQRTYKIDVETDSTIGSTIQEDMQGLTQLLTGITQFMGGVAPAIQMGALPMEAAKEIMLTIVRRSKMGNAVEDALDKMEKPAAQPDPQAGEQAKQQAEMQKHQAEIQAKQQEAQASQQLEQAKLQQEMQLEQFRAQNAAQTEQLRAQADAEASQAQAQATMQVEQLKAQLQAQIEADKMQHELQLEAMRLERTQEFDRWKAELDASTKITIAQISAQTAQNASILAAETAANNEINREIV